MTDLHVGVGGLPRWQRLRGVVEQVPELRQVGRAWGRHHQRPAAAQHAPELRRGARRKDADYHVKHLRHDAQSNLT